MPRPGSCSRCGAEFSDDSSLGDHCPRCLLQLGLRAPSSALPGCADASRRLRFGDFLLVRKLGRGPLGVVHEAQQESTGRVVALKRWSIAGPSTLETPAARESRPSGAIRHPGVVPVHARGLRDETSYVATELMTEGSLRHSIEQRRSRSRERDPSARISRDLRLFEEVANTLHEVHERGVVHRGIKPENLFLAADGSRLLLSDFPPANSADVLAVSWADDADRALSYMAPEQLSAGGKNVDARADIYALGACIYESATLISHSPPTSSRDRSRDVSPGLEAVLLQCLQAEPDRRYASARELQRELRRVAEGNDPKARGKTRRGGSFLDRFRRG